MLHQLLNQRHVFERAATSPRRKSVSHNRVTVLALMASSLLVLSACTAVAPNPGTDTGALVIDGETIADAATYTAAKSEGSITLYTSWGQAKEELYGQQFESETGIRVNVVRLSAPELQQRIQSERAAGIHTADVYRGGLVLMPPLSESGALEAYSPLTAEGVDDAYKYDDGNFTVWMQDAYTFGYNTERVDASEAPASWVDFADPKWTNDIAITDPVAGEYSTSAVYEFMRQEISPDYWEKLAALNPQVLGGAGQVIESLGRGETAVGLLLLGTAVTAIDEGAPIEFVVPTDGLPVYENAVALAADAPSPNAARVFLNYVFSNAGQSFAASDFGSYSVRADVAAPKANGRDLPARDSVWEQDFTQVHANYEQYITEWKSTFE